VDFWAEYEGLSQQQGNVQLHNSSSTCDIQIAWQWEMVHVTTNNKPKQTNEKFSGQLKVLETAARF